MRYPAGLVCAALDMAVMRIDIPSGAIFHSDRGSQYTSREFAVTLNRHGMRHLLRCPENAGHVSGSASRWPGWATTPAV
ncbi:DDE-type integrase/transposase/recombinase [Microtetraspora sp. NBRC 13810]|uniref:DDE-type integrase/transposase/recombinase n=1 Tax=Microtetraspora sp. NBRC 13810 TaxID=3030990 RepID=UPI0033242D28